jgi:benzoyl-CoA reductase/2-hydroxyglutaryl-CoA dehydratase subunit BcrC/BadD/HgdB
MRKNPFHNFTKEALKEMVESHNATAREYQMMPKLNMKDPKIRAAVERGKKIANKMLIAQHKELAVALKKSEKVIEATEGRKIKLYLPKLRLFK